MSTKQAFSRRGFLTHLGRLCAGVIGLSTVVACGRDDQRSLDDGAQLAGLEGAASSADSTEVTTLSEMIAALFPGPGIEDSHYLEAARQVQSIAAAMGGTELISTGISELNASGWATQDGNERTEQLRSIEGSGFFQFVRFNATGALYGNLEVGRLYGYEGESFSKGGYVNRGVNDLAWLPEPTLMQ